MNQFDPNQAPVQQVPPETPPTQPAPVAQGQQFQMPQEQMPPQMPPQTPPPGGPPMGNQPPIGQGFEPVGMEPQHGGGKTWILIIILLILLILGGVVFAAWEGWLNWGPLNKLLGKTTSSETATTTTTEKPVDNDTTRKKDITTIKDALKQYYQANQTYPISTTVDKSNSPTTILNALVPTYLKSIPQDPVSSRYFGYKSDGKTFELTAVLDNTSDPAGIKSGNYYIYRVTDTSTETPTS